MSNDSTATMEDLETQVKRAIESGLATELIRLRLSEHGLKPEGMSFGTRLEWDATERVYQTTTLGLEEAVYRHVPGQEILATLKNAMQRRLGSVHEQKFQLPGGEETTYEHDDCQFVSQSEVGTAFYFAMDGEMEHLRAFTESYPEATQSLNAGLSHLTNNADTPEELQKYVKRFLDRAFVQQSKQVIRRGISTPKLVQLASLLTQADDVNELKPLHWDVIDRQKFLELEASKHAMAMLSNGRLTEAIPFAQSYGASGIRMAKKISSELAAALRTGSVPPELIRMGWALGTIGRTEFAEKLCGKKLHPSLVELFIPPKEEGSGEPSLNDWKMGYEILQMLDGTRVKIVRESGDIIEYSRSNSAGICKKEGSSQRSSFITTGRGETSLFHLLHDKLGKMEEHDFTLYGLGAYLDQWDAIVENMQRVHARMQEEVGDGQVVLGQDFLDQGMQVISQFIYDGDDQDIERGLTLANLTNLVGFYRRGFDQDIERAIQLGVIPTHLPVVAEWFTNREYETAKANEDTEEQETYEDCLSILIEAFMKSSEERNRVIPEIIALADKADTCDLRRNRPYQNRKQQIIDRYRTVAEKAISSRADPTAVLQAIEFTEEYGLSDGFLEQNLEASVGAGQLNMILVDAAKASGKIELVQKAYRPMLAELLVDTDKDSPSHGVGVHVARALGLEGEFTLEESDETIPYSIETIEEMITQSSNRAEIFEGVKLARMLGKGEHYEAVFDRAVGLAAVHGQADPRYALLASAYTTSEKDKAQEVLGTLLQVGLRRGIISSDVLSLAKDMDSEDERSGRETQNREQSVIDVYRGFAQNIIITSTDQDQIADACGFAAEHNLEEGFLESQLAASVETSKIRPSLIYLARATGQMSAAQDAYRPFVGRLLRGKTPQHRTAGQKVATDLGLQEEFSEYFK